jgi:hypothetical protein
MKEKNVTHHIFRCFEGLRGAVLAQAGSLTLLFVQRGYDKRKKARALGGVWIPLPRTGEEGEQELFWCVA